MPKIPRINAIRLEYAACAFIRSSPFERAWIPLDTRGRDILRSQLLPSHEANAG
jgi:hypothetical protein